MKRKIDEFTAEFEQLTEWLEEVLGDKLKSTSKELMVIGVEPITITSAKWIKEAFSQKGRQVKWKVFAVLPCQLRREVGSTERRSVKLHLHFTLQSAHLSAALVTDAPTHPRWPEVATKQSCIRHTLVFLSSPSSHLFSSSSSEHSTCIRTVRNHCSGHTTNQTEK